MAQQFDMSRFANAKRREPTVPADNGAMHYGTGVKGAACGVEDPNRKETSDWLKVTCHGCRSFRRKAR